MNELKEVIKEAKKIAMVNQVLLEKLYEKSPDFLLDDLFEITKIFVGKKNPEKFKTFTLQNFQESDPDAYFEKIFKGFCNALVEIGTNELLDSDKNRIDEIINNREKYEQNN